MTKVFLPFENGDFHK